MNEPRGHAAMSGAILQPPTRADCDFGRGLHRGVRLPADVRSRHHRRGHRAGRDRHGRGRRAGHHGPARHPGRPGHRRGRRQRRPRRVGDHRERAELRGAAGRCRLGAGPRRRCPTAWRSAATSTRWSISTTSGLPFDRAAAARHPRGRAGDHGCDQHHRTAAAPADRRRQPLPPRAVHRAGLGCAGSPGTRWRSIRAGSTARRAAPERRRGWPSSGAAASSA